MDEGIKKGKANFSEYYVTEGFKEVLKKAFEYKKIAKRAYLFVLLITLGAAIILGIIVGTITSGNPGYIIGRTNWTE